MEPNSHNLFYVTDLSNRKDSSGRPLTMADIRAQPIALLISPYASLRDTLEYVQKMFTTEIAPLQAKHRATSSIIGRQRKSDPTIRERDEVIYQNRNLPYKKIAEIIRKKFPANLVDEGLVGKVISRETKKRQQA